MIALRHPPRSLAVPVVRVTAVLIAFGCAVASAATTPAPRPTVPGRAAHLAKASKLPACLGPLVVPGAPAGAAPCAPLPAAAKPQPAAHRQSVPAAEPRAHNHHLRTALIIAAVTAATGIIVYLATRGCPPNSFSNGSGCQPVPSAR